MCYVLSCFSRVQLFATPWIIAYQAPLSLDSSGKNAGFGSHPLLWRIFLTEGLNPGVPHSRQILYQLSYQENPVPGYISLFHGIMERTHVLEICQMQFESHLCHLLAVLLWASLLCFLCLSILIYEIQFIG